MRSRSAICGGPGADGERETTVRTLTLPAEFGSRTVEVAGDFTAWAPVVMDRDHVDGHSLTVRLQPHRRWHYRYRLDGGRWVNDPAADDYVDCARCGAVSVLDT